MVRLDSSVRLIVVQFSCSNSDAIPKGVMRRAERETPKEGRERRKRSSGYLVIEPTENCSLIEFRRGLEAVDYRLVDAFYQERPKPKDSRGKEMYHIARFLFARNEFVADLSDEFTGACDKIRAALSWMYLRAMWRVRVFSNPFYEQGKEIPGQRVLSINLEARKPFFRPDGNPVTVWQKDESDKRLDDAPLPLKAEHRLLVMDNVIKLVKVKV